MGNDGNPYCLLVVNGSFTAPTVKALQWKLDSEGYDLTIDGQYGPATEGATAFHVGAPENGTLYPGNGTPQASVEALQRHIVACGFPIKVDGYWGNLTTNGLQLSLNNTHF